MYINLKKWVTTCTRNLLQKLQDVGSNIIYYGDDVPLEDIQIVALTLLKEQIPLKMIKHTKFEWKSSAIEIGTDTSISNDQPNISIKEILDFDKQYLGSY